MHDKDNYRAWHDEPRAIFQHRLFAREPLFPKERQRPSAACAYARLMQLLPPELAHLSLAESCSPLAYSAHRLRKPPRGNWVPRKVQQIPDYFTPEEAVALVEGTPSYPTRMAFRIMLKTGLRVSEALALRCVDLRLDQDPPIIVVRADSPGNKARKGREVPVPADLVESLHDLASFHNKDRQRPMLDISRWRLSQVVKETARNVGIDPARAHPYAFRHTYGRNCVLRGVPIPVLQKWLGHQSLKDTQRYVELAGAHHEWVSTTVSH